jgi:CheY-like chemotaxis protein
VELTISNTGPGIPPDKLDRVFDRFYQIDDSITRRQEGTGIGLALTKELVELHHGTITVNSGFERHPPQSPPPKGGSSTLNREALYNTTFTVLLPIGREHFSDNEILEGTLEQFSEKESSSSPEIKSSIPDKKSLLPVDLSGSSRPGFDKHRASSIEYRGSSILIVEDNPDVTEYITSFLKNEYRIITAENGKEGLKKTMKKDPALIISDVMMPEMDGFELCNKIKSDERTSHIPVILLTAKADMDSRIEGLEFGADDYISKPFEAREVQVRIKNLIEQRKKLQEKFSQMIEIEPGEIATTSMDEQFLQRLLDVFENHVAESDFSTEDFAREVGMSRSNLHRKLQALTNQSTHEFIRTLRLKRAAQLLKKSAGTVAEIAYNVGFIDPSYFTKIFRQHFGKTPSEFVNKKQ